MKKNVKYLGAAAAALLAVAPVAVSGVAQAADANASTPAQTANNVIKGTVSANAITVPNNTLADAYLGNFTVNTTLGTVSYGNAADVKLVDTTNNNAEVKKGEKLVAGHVYQQTESVAVNGLQNDKSYSFNGENAQTPSYGTISNISVTRTIYVTDSANATQPYFTSNGTQLPNGGVANVGTNGAGLTLAEGTSATAQNILDAAKNSVGLVAGTQAGTTAVVTTTTADIASQLSGQGVTAKDGVYTIPANGFHVTLTGMNTTSGKTVQVIVPFAGKSVVTDYSSFPYMTATAGSTSVTNQGPLTQQSVKPSEAVVNVAVGGSFNPISAVKATASTAKENGSNLDISVLSNPVNVNVPGKYTVTLQATNWANGKTSYLSYTVQVGDANTEYKTVKYVKGYSVNVWNVAGNLVSFSGSRIADGKSVATFDTKTINGVSYTRINSKDSNEWIQTQYLDGSYTKPENNKPSTDTSKEEKVSGVVTVVYNGRGGVKLLNGKGQYQEQVVKNGSSWKVFAKKTINGKTYYKLGNDNQWIPAQYVNFR